MPRAENDDDRETTLLHGTTLDVAEAIVAQSKFELRETFFAQVQTLAEYFAVRTSRKRARVHRPAIVRVTLYESDLRAWRRNRWVTSKGFDEGDAPELRGQTQLLFSAEGMRMLNTYMFKDALRAEPVTIDA